ncbi:uncharacterized protein A4U43_C09F3690 [Asparagus officinalis]|uniref:Endoglucanase n=1 Tax=Asparagus officinalis TaxID=4686 RepID=A0A5P1E5D0_ASPOF|nr:endoglucanase 3-like [Asparagus officinalis]XP_020246737.1 endoglucanase 3-like [Asparagus officinalis]ONK57748.1 uncharacterized protein A4U43_C09F3690 [Asparagus officinalis]
MASSLRLVALALFLFSLSFCFEIEGHPNYGDALAKSFLFFQGQRSGRIPSGQKISWRSNSGLSDGSAVNVDLTGGYYDAGDNVKFNFPMAYSTTMLSWSVIEYGKRMHKQLANARAAIRWSTDYLLECSSSVPSRLYVGVGEPNADHKCWERPEDMDTPRNVYWVSPDKPGDKPGSDVAGETAAALAAASMVFKKADKEYAKKLVATAKKVMDFAMKYQGRYSDSLGGAVCPFYCSYSGYKDELLWGAAWLYRVTNDVKYLSYLKSLGANDVPDIFSWDNKYAGAYVLLARKIIVGKDSSFELFRQQAENFMCKILPDSPYSSTQYTPGGLMYKMSSANLQYVTSISFLLSTYGKYMMPFGHTFNCGNLSVNANTLRKLAKRQVDYILGQNPLKMSYMVGYGPRYPQKIHHRGSSLPSIFTYPNKIGCQDGFRYLNSGNPNPNMLTGAVVGGPDGNDAFPDDRNDYARSEPTTYINAAIVGPLAYLVGSYG